MLLLAGSMDYVIAAAPVGETLMVRGTVEVKHADGAIASVEKGDRVFIGDLINTSARSYAIIGFADGAKITVRPDSSVSVDDYSAKSSRLNLLQGGLRAITGAFGRNDPESFRVQTPVATLGIRGTEFDARICEDSDCASENELHQDKITVEDEDCPVELEHIKPGVYATTYYGATYYIQDDEVTLELGEEEAGYLAEGEATCLNQVPAFLLHDPTPWPGGFGAAVPAIGTGAPGGIAPPPPPVVPPTPSASVPIREPLPPPRPISPS